MEEGVPQDQRSMSGRGHAPTVSLYSFGSGLSTYDRLRNMMKDSKDSRLKDFAMMLTVVLIPILSLISLATVEFAASIKTRKLVDKSKSTILQEFDIASVALNLQVERGMTAMFLSSGKTNAGAYQRLLKKQASTDESLIGVGVWPELGISVLNQTMESAHELRSFLQKYRNRVLTDNIEFEYNIWFYTNVTHALMDFAESKQEMPSRYTVWRFMVANAAILRISDAVGIQRALGSTFFTLCGYSPSNFVWFISLDGKQKAYFANAFMYCGSCESLYKKSTTEEAELMSDIARKKRYMGNRDWQRNCSQFSSNEANFSNSQSWFDDITAYIDILVEVRLHAQNLMISALTDMDSEANASVAAYSVVIILITFGSLAVGFWYTVNLRKIITAVRDYTLRLREKSQALASEKKRTEIILNQMLPLAAIEQLKSGNRVSAEHYDSVTVMFSDIVGFTKFASSVPPLQVVDVLDELYRVLDDHVDMRDAYKVETIGDAYMIVSGAPQRNGDKHAAEIAEVALSFLMAVTSFRVPHAPSHKMKMRVGLHSGPCVAGVVGTKMPRYCLFGDTVVMAGNLEQTAKEMTIHISEATKLLLDSQTCFRVTYRGEVLVKGKRRKTYWLVSGPTQTVKPVGLRPQFGEVRDIVLD